jgi:hypothetical protein
VDLQSDSRALEEQARRFTHDIELEPKCEGLELEVECEWLDWARPDRKQLEQWEMIKIRSVAVLVQI